MSNAFSSLRQGACRLAALTLLAAGFLLAGCGPKLDWREVRGADNAWVALLPAKPIEQTRSVNLNGLRADMDMRAAEVAEVTYAVGSLRVPHASLAAASLQAMKDALLKNVGATMQSVKTSSVDGKVIIDVEAIGTPADGGGRGRPRAVFARFIARDTLLVQAVVIGPQDRVSHEPVQTFLDGFRVE